MTKQLTIYTARPLTGCNYDEIIEYYEDLTSILTDNNYNVFCPMAAKEKLKGEKNLKAHGYTGNPITTDHAIIERDRWMLGQSDIVLMDLTMSRNISIGCMFELAWAYEHRKHTIVIMEQNNIHEHCFVKEAADIIFNDIVEAIHYLSDLKKGV